MSEQKTVACFVKGQAWTADVIHMVDVPAGRPVDFQAPARCGLAPKDLWAEISQAITSAGSVDFCPDCVALAPAAGEEVRA